MELQSASEEIERRGARLWAVSADDPDRLRTFRDAERVEFPILVDPEAATIEAWGLFNDDDRKGRAIPHPTTVVVGGDGLITFAVVNPNYKERPSVEEILGALDDS